MLLTVSLSFLLGICVAKHDDTLEIVHVIFRHGEKNPDMKYTFPTDPNKNATFETDPQGQLNKIGRNTMYDLGLTLRKRYNNFLGKYYSESFAEAWASPFPRTILSLQLVMASLFAPSEGQRWHKDLNWQPTVYHTINWNDDKIFLNMKSPEYIREYEAACQSDEVRSTMKKYAHVSKILEENAGITVKCLRQPYGLYMILEAENEAHWKLPAWTHEVYPEPLREFSLLDYNLQISNNKLRRLIMGELFLKLLSDTENKIKLKSPKKIHLYAGHDVTIHHVLALLGFDTVEPHFPGYGSCVIIEVHKVGKNHILKVSYRATKHETFKRLKNQHDHNNITYKEFENIVRVLFDKNLSLVPYVHGSLWVISMMLCIFVVI